jgi:hypothetical protein
LWCDILLMAPTEVRAVGTVTAAMTPAPPVPESILPTISLLIAIRPGILLRLATATRNKCRKAAYVLTTFP